MDFERLYQARVLKLPHMIALLPYALDDIDHAYGEAVCEARDALRVKPWRLRRADE